jgi:hypothetical protein
MSHRQRFCDVQLDLFEGRPSTSHWGGLSAIPNAQLARALALLRERTARLIVEGMCPGLTPERGETVQRAEQSTRRGVTWIRREQLRRQRGQLIESAGKQNPNDEASRFCDQGWRTSSDI